MEIAAPAKINLYLDVTGKRPDGYHELVTLMCSIGVYDTVRLNFDAPDIRVFCPHPDVPEDGTNVACRAAALFFAKTGISSGVHIAIEKTIPVGAGLGGGSSDAAAVLTGLNRHFGEPFSGDDLLRISAAIGADVPFFIPGKPVVATGIGEKLAPLPLTRSYPVVLIYPGIPLSTAAVYKNLNFGLTKNEKKNTKTIFELDWDASAPKFLYNALEPAAFQLCPQIQVAKAELLANGAAGALMSGSGSSVYGLFTNESEAEKAHRHLSGHPGWRVFRTQLRV